MLAVTMATYVARNWPGDPLWVLTVGPPSTGKTASATLLDTSAHVHSVSSLTPASLITVYGGVDHDRSLIPTFNEGLVIIKDFGTILTLGFEQTNQVLGILREAFDGHVSKDFAPLRREYDVHFGIVAVCTCVADIHASLLQQLGERFLKYRPEPIQLPWPAPQIHPRTKELVALYVSQLCPPATPPTPKTPLLAHSAELVAHLRTMPIHDHHLHEIVEIPQFEQPHRLVRQLEKLWAGLYLSTGDAGLATRIALKAALDSVPPRRLQLLQMLFREPNLTTAEITERNGIGSTTMRLMLADMEALGLLEKESDGFPKFYTWRVPEGLHAQITEIFGAI